MKVFSAEYLNELTQQAKFAPRQRQHRNIHQDYLDPCQRMFNAIEPHSYIPPHRHSAVPRDELLIAIRGLMALVTFDDQGQINHVLRFGSETYGAELAAGAEVSSDTWHTVIALEPGSVLLEVKAGPFDAGHAKEVAPWAPEENSIQAAAFLLQFSSITPSP
jgi:cupin fold WbuC family metalloprotein